MSGLMRIVKVRRREPLDANKELIWAAQLGDNEALSKALVEGAEITHRERNLTGLHFAVLLGHDSVVKIFCENGIDVNIRIDDDNRGTALMIAAYNNKISCLQILLDNGADPDIKSEKDGQTSLMYAVQMNNIEVMAELLIKGADPEIHSISGKTAIQLAQEKKRQ